MVEVVLLSFRHVRAGATAMLKLAYPIDNLAQLAITTLLAMQQYAE